MPALTALHSHQAGGIAWRLAAAGIQVGVNPAGRTPGPPATVSRVWRWFGTEIRAAALKHHVPVELIVACMCAESGRSGQTVSSQMSEAYREEPGYVSDDATPGKVSAGCMQTLLSTARDVTGNAALTVHDLFDPAVSIDAGAAYIAEQAARAGIQATAFDAPLVAAAYNAGGLYHDNAAANRWRLRCYPLGTGEHINRFILWFNDAMSLGTVQAGAAPSFARALARGPAS